MATEPIPYHRQAALDAVRLADRDNHNALHRGFAVAQVHATLAVAEAIERQAQRANVSDTAHKLRTALRMQAQSDRERMVTPDEAVELVRETAHALLAALGESGDA